MDAVAMPHDQRAEPRHWVDKWTYDEGMHEGFGYKLSSGSYGILFHDGVQMRLTTNKYLDHI